MVRMVQVWYNGSRGIVHKLATVHNELEWLPWFSSRSRILVTLLVHFLDFKVLVHYVCVVLGECVEVRLF